MRYPEMFEIDRYPEIISFFQQSIQKLEQSHRTPEKIRELIHNGSAIFEVANAQYDELACEKLARYFEQQFEKLCKYEKPSNMSPKSSNHGPQNLQTITNILP